MSVASRPIAAVMPGYGGTITARRPDLERDLRREQRAGAALGDEREVARVVALAHRVLLDRLHHRVGEDLDRAHRRLLDASCRAPARGPVLERLAGELGASSMPPPRNASGEQPAEVDHRVGRGRPRCRRGRTRPGRDRRRPSAARRGRCRPGRRRRSSRRRRRSCRRRPSGSSPGTARPSCRAGASCAARPPARGRCRPTCRRRRA